MESTLSSDQPPDLSALFHNPTTDKATLRAYATHRDLGKVVCTPDMGIFASLLVLNARERMGWSVPVMEACAQYFVDEDFRKLRLLARMVDADFRTLRRTSAQYGFPAVMVTYLQRLLESLGLRPPQPSILDPQIPEASNGYPHYASIFSAYAPPSAPKYPSAPPTISKEPSTQPPQPRPPVIPPVPIPLPTEGPVMQQQTHTHQNRPRDDQETTLAEMIKGEIADPHPAPAAPSQTVINPPAQFVNSNPEQPTPEGGHIVRSQAVPAPHTPTDIGKLCYTCRDQSTHNSHFGDGVGGVDSGNEAHTEPERCVVGVGKNEDTDASGIKMDHTNGDGQPTEQKSTHEPAVQSPPIRQAPRTPVPPGTPQPSAPTNRPAAVQPPQSTTGESTTNTGTPRQFLGVIDLTLDESDDPPPPPHPPPTHNTINIPDTQTVHPEPAKRTHSETESIENIETGISAEEPRLKKSRTIVPSFKAVRFPGPQQQISHPQDDSGGLRDKKKSMEEDDGQNHSDKGGECCGEKPTERKWSCIFTACKFTTTDRDEMKKHKSEHHGGHKCHRNNCDAVFATKKSLWQHETNVHLKFTCTYDGCKCRYANRNSLSLHSRAHQNAPPNFPFICNLSRCPYTFSTEPELEKHRKHHGMKKEDSERYICLEQQCGLRFKYGTGLRRHIERAHGGDGKDRTPKYLCVNDGCREVFDKGVALANHKRGCRYG